MREHEIRLAESPADLAVARELFEEYARATGGETCFQGFSGELAGLSDVYGAPHGGLLLAFREGRAVACVGLRAHPSGGCEMKRLYVRPEARGKGLGRELAERLLELARTAGYQRMRLDTLPSMAAAQALYYTLGFRACTPEHGAAAPGVIYMELDLIGPIVRVASRP